MLTVFKLFGTIIPTTIRSKIFGTFVPKITIKNLVVVAQTLLALTHAYCRLRALRLFHLSRVS
jgi:hypothetical protein